MKHNTDPAQARLLSNLGLCARARALIYGTAMVCEALRNSGRVVLVLEASDTSPATHKRISDKCNFYKVTHLRLPVSGDILAAALGKSATLAAVAITDEGLSRPVRAAWEALTTQTSEP